MKITLALTLIFFVWTGRAHTESTAERRSNGLLNFIIAQEGLRDWGLGTLLNNRCNRYMGYWDKAACRNAVKKMIQILDYDMVVDERRATTHKSTVWTPGSFVFVAFKKNFIALLNTPKTQVYLKDLNEQLYKYLTGEIKNLNIWDLTLRHFNSPYLASMVMATLFQDTSTKKLHMAYLERAQIRGNALYQNNKEMVSRVIDTINLILDLSEDNYRKLFYPPEIYEHLNRNIYHFYVPLFLSMSLAREGVPTQFAYSAALMLTLTYEFITSANDYRYLFEDPQTITSLGKLRDIFGGYSGANIGVRGMNFNKSFVIIQESFARSTKDSVELLLRH